MTRLLATLCLFVSLGLPAFAQETMPDVEVKTLDGQAVNATEIGAEDGPTVVAFWATWCSPCKNELDAYMEAYEDWKEAYGAEVYAVTIDTRRQLSKVRPMVESKGWEFPILSDANSQLMQALNFQTVPQVFVLDAGGNIVYSHSGYVPGDELEVEEKLEALSKG